MREAEARHGGEAVAIHLDLYRAGAPGRLDGFS